MKTGDLASKLKGYDDDEDEEEEEEEEDEDMMAVEGSDGQQYVVLEVIQLADNQGSDQVKNPFKVKFIQIVNLRLFGNILMP